MKLSRDLYIPVEWVFAICGVLVTSAITGTFYVAQVNERLARIEDKLGIIPYAENHLIKDANANGLIFSK